MDKKSDWIIHYVTIGDDKYKYIVNIHTHGLNKYNHKEFCMVLDIGSICSEIINSICHDVVFNGKIFSEGIYSGISENKYNIEIISLPNDPVLYIILPDENNKLPSDKDCQYPYNQQYKYVKTISAMNN